MSNVQNLAVLDINVMNERIQKRNERSKDVASLGRIL